MDAPTTAVPDHYAALGVSPLASGHEIRAAWRRLSRTTHPDVGGDPSAFAALSAAHHVLSSPQRRAAYDVSLAPVVEQVGPPPLRPVGETDRMVREYLAERSAQREALQRSALAEPSTSRPGPLRRLLRRT